jgi:FtsP/CotA-like multicopper oxidase with cupredoxin domain
MAGILPAVHDDRVESMTRRSMLRARARRHETAIEGGAMVRLRAASRAWRDTLLLDPDHSAEIAFVADNPGDWMFHCHILQHQQGGLMGSIRVS